MSEAAPSSALPPFFNGLEALNSERHAALRVRPAGFGFARDAHLLPLMADEFTVAARTLPIVFNLEAPFMPIAVLALQPGQAHLINDKGVWEANTYIPAYVRCYPFILVKPQADSDTMTLCIDPQAKALSTSEGEPLFGADKKPTQAAQQALEFCQGYEIARQKTKAMVDKLVELELLEPGVVQFMQNGQQRRVDGFRAVDRAKLQQLPADKLAELRDLGYLDAIFAHLLSIGGVPALAQDIATQS